MKKREGYALTKIEDAYYLLPYGQRIAEQKKGILLNEIGAFLWEELDKCQDKEALEERLAEYVEAEEGDRESLHRDVEVFLGGLKQMGLLYETEEEVRECAPKPQKVDEEEKADVSRLSESENSLKNGFQRVEDFLQPVERIMEIAGFQISLRGRECLLPEEFVPFLKRENIGKQGEQIDTEQTEDAKLMTADAGVTDTISAQRKDEEIEENRQPDQRIEILEKMPAYQENGQILLRTAEVIICENRNGYGILFLQMESVREAWISRDAGKVRLYAVSGRREEIFHAIRFVVLYFLQKKGLFVMHSASIEYKGKAWLFSGHSGMGKSTHTALWKEIVGTPLLNGDLNLVGKGKEGWRVYGLPWCGTSGICTTKCYLLGGIVLLGRAQSDHVEEIAEEEKPLRVMQRMITPAWTRDLMLFNLRLAEEVTKSVPVWKLFCTKNPSAVETIRARIDEWLSDEQKIERKES